MPFSRADRRAILLLGGLALLATGLSLLTAESTPQSWPGLALGDQQLHSPIWINLASPAELTSLPGIGPVLARRILSYRSLHGPFRSLAELERVVGIGPQTLTKLSSRVRFDCPAALC